MELYPNKHSKEFIRLIRNQMSLKKDAQIKQNAIPVSKPFIAEGKKFTHCIRIDIMGIAASLLFDTGNNIVKSNIFDSVIELLDAAPKLNEEGYFVRFRVLLLYPYSTPAYCQIQAEWSANRAAIREPTYKRNLQFVEQVDDDIHKMSAMTLHQTIVLDQIQQLLERYNKTPDWNKYRQNEIVLRFTPVAPSVHGLILNSSAFYDPYLYAKELRNKKVSKSFLPCINIKKDDGISFQALEDHFRYLWELDVTMDMTDATYYDAGIPRSLSKIKEPELINFESKANRIKKKNRTLTNADISHWQSCVQRTLSKFCTTLAPTPAAESIFITCSWSEDDDDNTSPNLDATNLSHFLYEDFSKEPDKLLSVRIVEAVPGKFLAQQVYSALHDTTVGIVVMTRDVKLENGEYMSKPNVYHELGYLMRQLGTNRVLILEERKVHIPTNVNDVVRLQFTREKISLVYRDIADWLLEIGAIHKPSIPTIISNHTKRLRKFAHKRQLTDNQAQSAIKKLQFK